MFNLAKICDIAHVLNIVCFLPVSDVLDTFKKGKNKCFCSSIEISIAFGKL